MAIIKDPDRTQWRNSEAGITNQKQWFPAGNRNRRKPVNHHNNVQGSQKYAFPAIITLWRSLSDPERAVWVTFGIDNPETDKYGDEITIGGWQWFTRLNAILLQNGQPLITVPPASPTGSYNPAFIVEQNSTTMNLQLTPVPAPTGNESFRVRRALNQPVSRVQPTNQYRTFLIGNASTGAPVIVAQSSELIVADIRHKFSLQAADGFGRQATLEYDDIVLITTP